MLVRILDLSLRHRFFVLAIMATMAAVGVWSFQQLKLEAYPDISDPGVVIVTVYPGFAAEEVEKQVTVPIERALNNAPNVIARRSRTIFGLSVVELTFTDDTNDYFARQVVLERLRDADLPDGVTPTLGPLIGGISEFYRYVIQGPGYDAMQLRELQDWVLTPRLLQVPGVADVATFGGLVRQYEVQVDPNQLNRYNFSVKQIADSIKNNNRNAGGALLRMGQQSLAVRGSGLITSNEDLENIILDSPKNVPVFVRDVGKVAPGNFPQTGIFAVNDDPIGPGGVEGIVLMRRGENPSEVLRNIHEAVDDINASRLPNGVRIVPIHDKTELVQSTLDTISRVLIEGFVIVVTVLLLFLLSFRAALLAALTIPLSLLFAFICMQTAGVSLSLLSIGALDFGILVDATIVMVERILRAIHEDPGTDERQNLPRRIRIAAVAVQRPILFSLIIIISAYIPLLTLQRVERRLFTPMAMTVCFALLGSLVLCLTLVPVLATFFFKGRHPVHEHRVLDFVVALYAKAVHATIRVAWLTVLLAACIVGGALYLGSHLGSEFLPTLDEGLIWIRANLPSGAALEKSAEVARTVRLEIRKSPEVQSVMSQTGRNDSGTDPFGPNRNEFLLNLHPYGEWKSGRTKAQLVDELRQRVQNAVPNVVLNFSQPIIDTATEIATGSSADLAVIISGPDLNQLRTIAARTLTLLKTIPGSVDASIEQERDQAQLRIAVDRYQVARYGINVGDVQDVIDLAIGGSPVTTVFEGDRHFNVVARLAPEARASPDSIGKLLIPVRDGARVPLSELANIRVEDGASIVLRRENERAIAIRTNIRGRDQGSFVAEAQTRFADNVSLPRGYRVNWGGQFENFSRAKKRLVTIVPVTILIIFVFLFVTFGNAMDALLVLLNVPFSLAGGLILLYLRGMNLSVSAAVGFISLFGVAVMSGLLYISEINARRSDPAASVRDAVIEGARSQFRPRLILIVVAALGMLPAALASGIGSDIQRPLATVVVGGLVSTLFLTLFALPAVYWLVRGRQGAGAR